MTPKDIKEKYPALSSLIERIENEAGKVTVVIDGNSGSGKSVLGEMLREAFDGNLYHADDYFLPKVRKTPDRLSEPGGNIDYERMRDELALPLSAGEQVFCRRYDCGSGTLGETVEMPDKCVSIIEGVYSMHREMQICGAVRVLLTLSPELQRERILKRNGEFILSRYEKEWLPLEKNYFDSYKLWDSCDYVYKVEENNGETVYYEV
ncbi:MAG: hypothetical protein IKV54_06090 [Clostridia bacterium]|nr:hypothetical protein [Clostridia bacterium]